MVRWFQKGQSVDIFEKSLLLSVSDEVLSPFDREHVVPYFFRNYEVNAIKFCEELTFMEKFKGFNFSIDDADYQRMLGFVDNEWVEC